LFSKLPPLERLRTFERFEDVDDKKAKNIIQSLKTVIIYIKKLQKSDKLYPST
jgi:hypothetical protein